MVSSNCSYVGVTAHRLDNSSLFVTDSAVADDRFRVVRNINLFETKLSRYGYNAIRLQYRNIRYDTIITMYRAITTFVAIFSHPNVSVPPLKTLSTNMHCLVNFDRLNLMR